MIRGSRVFQGDTDLPLENGVEGRVVEEGRIRSGGKGQEWVGSGGKGCGGRREGLGVEGRVGSGGKGCGGGREGLGVEGRVVEEGGKGWEWREGLGVEGRVVWMLCKVISEHYYSINVSLIAITAMSNECLFITVFSHPLPEACSLATTWVPQVIRKCTMKSKTSKNLPPK